MAFTPIAPTETEFKAPIDETLMEKIRLNFDDHESRIGGGGGGGGSIAFKVNGSLVKLASLLGSDPTYGQKLDGAHVTAGQTFTRVRAYLKKNGNVGTTRFDLRRHIRVNHPITFVNFQMDRDIQSIGKVGSPLATQAATKRTPQINTQLINRAKGSVTGESVVVIEAGVSARYNLAGIALDADWKVGQKVKITGMGNANNNGEFFILEVNPEGHPGLVVGNTVAVNESGASGTINLQMFEYVFTNPVDVQGFKVGEIAILVGHTLAGNNGNFEIIRINDGGNNLIVYSNTIGADTQGAPAGVADSTRWVYTFAAAVLTTDYFQGENLFASGHVSGNNNGQFEVAEINQAGNNLVVINLNGAVQGGSGGAVETLRWIYAFNVDPDPDIDLGDIVIFSGCSSANNNGQFDVREINRFALNNIVVYNTIGVTQGGVAGVARSEKVVVGFDTDFSLDYDIARSFALLKGFVNIANNGEYKVVETNRGGGSAKNIVILNDSAIEELVPIGQVDLETRSLFNSPLPEIPTGEDVVFAGASAIFNPATVESDAMVTLDILELPDGLPEDFSIDLS